MDVQSKTYRSLVRCRAAGVEISDEQWASLPEPARRRLDRHPHHTEVDRRRLIALARWLVETFPPGWRRPP
jgi:hypothetical protein